MANVKTREKRRDQRKRASIKRNTLEELEDQYQETGEESFPVPEEPEPVEKEYAETMPMMGPTSYDELDAMRRAHEVAKAVREETWSVQDLVSNIAFSSMNPDQKSKAIVDVGKGFGKRLKAIVSEPMEKSTDMDLLEIQALLARDARHTGVMEKSLDFLATAFSTPAPDSKTHLRTQLKNTAKLLEKNQDDSIREEVPELIKKAKGAGLGGTPNSVIVEKDLTGSWRAVMWPTNNFKDLDGDILAEIAHKEYAEWVNKNMDCAPLFVVGHIPGTERESAVDFVAYESGFLLMSSQLTEKEAADLLRMQAVTDIGMSHGSLVLERDPQNENVITKYRMVEVSDLPLERAANPFTDFDVLSKEAAMDVKQYLIEMLGEERAVNYLAKTGLKQDSLRKAGVEEKEAATPSQPAVPAAPADGQPIDLAVLTEKLSKEFGMEQLSETILQLQEAADKVPVLEGLVKELLGSKEDALLEMIAPPIEKQLSWMTARPTQKKDNVLKKDETEDDKLKKSAPELGWLSEATHTEPVYQ